MKLSPFLSAALLSLAASMLLHKLGLVPALNGERVAVFGTLAQVAGTMVGFLLAALAVVASITDTPLLKAMRASGHYDALLQHMFAGTVLFIVSTVLCILVVLGVDLTAGALAAVFGVLSAALLVLLIVGWQFWLTLTFVSRPSPPQPPMVDLDS